MTTPRKILDRHELRPLKRYGQSFLIDKNIMVRIAEAASIGPGDRVVEIGPGVGIMTGMLADRAGSVIALEVDRRMIEVLEEELVERRNVTVINQDVLVYDFASALGTSGDALTVVGNIPYNISSQIVFRLIRFREHIRAAVLMFQRELAERILAHPGTPGYSSISVMTAMYFVPQRVIHVSPRCFFPEPKVDSLVLKFSTREKPLCEVKNPDLFQNLVRAAFSKRRKTLLNSLASNPYIELERKKILPILEEIGIDPQRRGETLTVEEYALLSNML